MSKDEDKINKSPVNKYLGEHVERKEKKDDDYEKFIEIHGSEGNTNVIYESKRANRQMGHFFDVSKYQKELDSTNLSKSSTSTTNSVKKPKPSKKEIAQFKKRKAERKKIKHKWLYE